MVDFLKVALSVKSDERQAYATAFLPPFTLFAVMLFLFIGPGLDGAVVGVLSGLVMGGLAVAALAPKAELEGEMGQAHVGLQARLMSQALRKLTAIVARSRTTVIFINQIRMQVGIMFGNPETTSGGRALKFYASVRIDVRRIAQIKKGDEVIGGRHRAKIVKNKVAPPFRVAEFDILYNEGISKYGDMLNLGEKYNIVSKSGATYTYEKETIGRGYDAARTFLKDHPKIAAEIVKKITSAATTES